MNKLLKKKIVMIKTMLTQNPKIINIKIRKNKENKNSKQKIRIL